MNITNNIDITVERFKFKDLKEKIKNTPITCELIATLLLLAIVILIPCMFLHYVYNQTLQIQLTYYLTGFAIFSMVVLKVYKLVNNVLVKKENIAFKFNIKIKLIDIFLIAYSILILVSALSSNYFPKTLLAGYIGRFEGAFTLYLYIVLFYIAYKLFKFSPKYLPYLACSSMLVSILGVLQALLEIGGNDYTYMGWSSFGNPNFFSSYLCIVIPIYMALYLKKNDPFYLITSVVTFAGLVTTKTLGGYITFLVYSTILVIYFLIKKIDIKRIITLFGLFIVIFALLNLATNNTYLNELTSLVEETKMAQDGNTEFGTGRGFIYKLTVEIIKQHPILGIGPDSLGGEVYLHHFYSPSYESTKLIDKAHSEYLQIAVCTGIPSLICYLLFICTIAITLLIKFIKDTDNFAIFVVGLSIISYLMQAAINISVTHVAPIFWIILGIGYKMCENTEYSKEISK